MPQDCTYSQIRAFPTCVWKHCHVVQSVEAVKSKRELRVHTLHSPVLLPWLHCEYLYAPGHCALTFLTRLMLELLCNPIYSSVTFLGR